MCFKHFLAIITFVLLGYLASSQELKTNHIIILDKTGSMEGYNNSPNIWSNVKESISNYVNDVSIGDKITLYFFDEEVDGPFIFEISETRDNEKVKNKIDNAEANGNYTCIYKSLLKIFKSIPNDEEYINLIYLYTDGKNSESYCGATTMCDVLNYYNSISKDNYCFYITLGLEIPQDVNDAITNCKDESTNLETIASLNGVPNLIIIKPRAHKVTFSKESKTINQGFRIINENLLPNNFQVSIEEINIKGLRAVDGQYDAELSPRSTYPKFNHKLSLSTLNPPKDKIYRGYYTYKKQPDKDVLGYIIPNKVSVTYDNTDRARVLIKYPTEEKTIKLKKGKRIERFIVLNFNNTAIQSNEKVDFIIKSNLNQSSYNFLQGSQKSKILSISAQNYKKYNNKGEEGICLVIEPDNELSSGRYNFEMEVLQVSDKLSNGLEYSYNERYSFEIDYHIPMPNYMKYLLGFMILLVVFHLLWFLFLKKLFYPSMTGMLNFREGSIRLNGYYKYLLYTTNKSKKISQSMFSKIYVGKIGFYKLAFKENDLLENSYIIIKPVKKGSKLRNRLYPKNLFIEPDFLLRHDYEYIISSDSSNEKSIFKYDNIKHI